MTWGTGDDLGQAMIWDRQCLGTDYDSEDRPRLGGQAMTWGDRQ